MADDSNDFTQQHIIPARTRREVMDWSLVLASQGIDSTILQTETGWGLSVDRRNVGPAERAIRQYILENRGWRWKLRVPGSRIGFHYGAAVWVAAIIGFYYWSMVAHPQLQAAGLMDNELAASGQPWRIFTAITLHENLPHLAANAGIGFLLMGFVMARYGPGVGTLMAFLAGACGNVLDLLLRPEEGRSLGASGMVMGALGLLSVHTIFIWRKHRASRNAMLRSAGAGFLFLVMTGFAPGTDMIAHVGGFIGGAMGGLALNLARPSVLQRATPNVIALLGLALLLAMAWHHAIASL